MAPYSTRAPGAGRAPGRIVPVNDSVTLATAPGKGEIPHDQEVRHAAGRHVFYRGRLCRRGPAPSRSPGHLYGAQGRHAVGHFGALFEQAVAVAGDLAGQPAGTEPAPDLS